MIKRVALLLCLLLAAGISAFAGTDAATEADYARYSGAWAGNGCWLELRWEAGEMTGSLTRYEASGDNEVWNFYHCAYVPDSDILWCSGCIYTRNRYDPSTSEFVEEDWRLTDLSDIYFAFGDSEDVLIGYDIAQIGEPVALERVSEEM